MIVSVGRNPPGFSEVDKNVLSPGIDGEYMRDPFVSNGTLKFLHFYVCKLYAKKK